jgi:topoisomerase-4 subunit A
MWYCELAGKERLAETVFSIVYRDNDTGQGYIKRCRIEQYILDKGYSIVPDNSTILKLSDKQQQELEVVYKPKPHVRILEETFDTDSFLVKSVRAQGVRLSTREIKSAKFTKKK